MATAPQNVLVPLPGDGTVGSMGIVYVEDFLTGPGFTASNATVASAQGKFSELADMGEWLVTVTDGDADGAESITIADNTNGGHAIFLTNDKDNDALSCQLNGEAWVLHATKKITFEISLNIDDITEVDWFVGLAITGTSIFAQAARIGFASEDSTGDIDAVSEKAGTPTTTDTTINLVDDTFAILRMEATTTEVKYFVDGVLGATHTTNIPLDNMTPTIELRNDGAVAQTATVDYILVSRVR